MKRSTGFCQNGTAVSFLNKLLQRSPFYCLQLLNIVRANFGILQRKIDR